MSQKECPDARPRSWRPACERRTTSSGRAAGSSARPASPSLRCGRRSQLGQGTMSSMGRRQCRPSEQRGAAGQERRRPSECGGSSCEDEDEREVRLARRCVRGAQKLDCLAERAASTRAAGASGPGRRRSWSTARGTRGVSPPGSLGAPVDPARPSRSSDRTLQKASGTGRPAEFILARRFGSARGATWLSPPSARSTTMLRRSGTHNTATMACTTPLVPGSPRPPRLVLLLALLLVPPRRPTTHPRRPRP